jgi:hypothetical protein
VEILYSRLLYPYKHIFVEQKERDEYLFTCVVLCRGTSINDLYRSFNIEIPKSPLWGYCFNGKKCTLAVFFALLVNKIFSANSARSYQAVRSETLYRFI